MQNSDDLGRGFSSFPLTLTIYSLCNHHTSLMRLVLLGSPFYWMRKQKGRKSGQMVCSESVVSEAQPELGLGPLVYSRTALCWGRRDSRHNPATVWGVPITAEQWAGRGNQRGRGTATVICLWHPTRDAALCWDRHRTELDGNQAGAWIKSLSEVTLGFPS